MLSKIIYISTRATTDYQAQKQENQDIQQSSWANNTDTDVTGLLVATNRHFIQILEGDAVRINALFESIKTDARHTRVELKASRLIEKRMFGGWAMNVIQINSIAAVIYGYRFDRLDIDPYALTYSAIAELIELSGSRI